MFLFFIFFASPVFAQPATNDSSALIPAYGEIPPAFFERHETIAIIGGITFLIFTALAVWKMLQPKPAVIFPPESVAREALAKLQSQPEDGKIVSEVSQILRRYVTAAFGLPTMELTTKEFCAAIAGHEKIGGELGGKISSLLRICDQDKFSPKNAAPPINAVLRAGELVALAESARIETQRRDAAATVR